MSKRTPRIEVVPVMGHPHAPDVPHYWRLVAGNGETVCTSEIFTTRRGACRAAKRLHGITGRAVVTIPAEVTW